MTIRRYHEFEILTDATPANFEADGTLTSFSVRVLRSPTGEGERNETVLIPDNRDLDTKRRHLDERRLDLQEQIAFGRRLAELLLPPYARQLFDRSLSALNRGEGLRIRLRLLPQLAHLPWEYMHLQDESERPAASGFLSLDARISIVRHEAIAIPPEDNPSRYVRRILIAMATPEPYSQFELLDTLPAEQQEITTALSKVKGVGVNCLPNYGGVLEWETIPGAQPEDLQNKIQELRPVDIFHFSGHGDFPREMAPVVGQYEGEGFIILADGENMAARLSGDELAGMLGRQGVRLVTLGACETGTRDIFNAWSSVAAALLTRGIPSVVAMQFRVRDSFAAAFMAAVYQALVAGATIDEAVFSGRAAMRALSYGKLADARDWGTPVLYSRVPGGSIFAPVADEEARQQAEQSLGALSSLHQAWWDWTDHRATASISQLRYLASLGESLEVQPAQALLMLRSAVAENEPVEAWLGHLRRTSAGLVSELDDPDAATTTMLREDASVFELEGAPQPDRPQDVGPVAWTAATHAVETTRHTAALALTALPPVPDAGLERLDGGLKGLKGPWKRVARRAELRGALADGDPQVEKANAGLPPWSRLGIWFWRFWRRVFHDWQRILLLTLGGGLGGGIGLGLLRALVVVFTLGKKAPASYLLMYGYLGFLVGTALCLGMLLAEPALLQSMRRRGERRTEPPGWRVQILAVLLGALFFGLSSAALAGLRGLSLIERPLVYGFGFVLGLGLNLALYGQPRTNRPLGVGNALLRVGLAAGISAAIQAVFLRFPNTGASLDVALSFNFYDAFFRDTPVGGCLEWITLLDAALAGAVLVVGLTEGLSLANRLSQWLQELQERAGT